MVQKVVVSILKCLCNFDMKAEIAYRLNCRGFSNCAIRVDLFHLLRWQCTTWMDSMFARAWLSTLPKWWEKWECVQIAYLPDFRGYFFLTWEWVMGNAYKLPIVRISGVNFFTLNTFSRQEFSNCDRARQKGIKCPNNV